MSFASFILAGIIMMFATGGTPPPMAQAQSFTIHTRLTNTSGFIHKLRHKLTRPLHLDQGMPSGTPPLTINLALDTLFPFTWVQTVDCRRYCFNLSYPFSNFDPRKSTTFQLLPPKSKQHHHLLTTHCSSVAFWFLVCLRRWL